MSQKLALVLRAPNLLLLPAPAPTSTPGLQRPAGPHYSSEASGPEEARQPALLSSRSGHLDVMRQQRDDLARRHRRLSAAVRRLERENESLRRELAAFQEYPSSEVREAEIMDARQLELELGLGFHAMPDDIYPGKPYVTQQDLIKRGTTRYSRQNMSRLARGERSIPALVIGDRVLLAPEGVRALLERERAAERDTSPRRRPGGNRRDRTQES